MKIFILTFAFISSVGFAQDRHDSKKTLNQRIKECTWNLLYSTRRLAHESNYKNTEKVLIPWPTGSKNMFFTDDGFQMALRGEGREIIPGAMLKHPMDIKPAMKILENYMRGYLDNFGGNINAYIAEHRNTLNRVLKQNEVDDIRDALCTCEENRVFVDAVVKAREDLFTSKYVPFSVETSVANVPLRVSDLSCDKPNS